MEAPERNSTDPTGDFHQYLNELLSRIFPPSTRCQKMGMTPPAHGGTGRHPHLLKKTREFNR
jgi:hypothetical protein